MQFQPGCKSRRPVDRLYAKSTVQFSIFITRHLTDISGDG